MSVFYLLRSPILRNSLNNGVFKNRISCTFCLSNTSFSSNTKIDAEAEGKPKKKTTIIPKITLINGSELLVTSLEEAQKLSKRRDLKLVKMVDLDTKTQRPIYKLMTGTEYHSEDIKQRALKKETKKNSIKGEKVLLINQKITEHDLQTHIKKINKWLGRMYEVRVVINGDSSNIEKAETVYALIEKSIEKETKIVQKRQKGSDIKFQILPSIKSKNQDENL